jgi:hypothetical protein
LAVNLVVVRGGRERNLACANDGLGIRWRKPKTATGFPQLPMRVFKSLP